MQEKRKASTEERVSRRYCQQTINTIVSDCPIRFTLTCCATTPRSEPRRCSSLGHVAHSARSSGDAQCTLQPIQHADVGHTGIRSIARILLSVASGCAKISMQPLASADKSASGRPASPAAGVPPAHCNTEEDAHTVHMRSSFLVTLVPSCPALRFPFECAFVSTATTERRSHRDGRREAASKQASEGEHIKQTQRQKGGFGGDADGVERKHTFR